MDRAAKITSAGLILTGLASGPLLLLILFIEGTIRAGYDRVRHGVSQLGTGEQGWPVQAAFIVCGVLFALFTLAIRWSKRAEPASAWVTTWFGVLALGLVLAGLAPTDPALGFPPGQPEPATMTAAAIVHQVGGALMFAGLIGGGISGARWLARTGKRSWAPLSLAAAVVVAATAVAAGVVYRLIQRGIIANGPAGLLELTSFIVGFGWTTGFAVHLLRRSRSPRAGQRA